MCETEKDNVDVHVSQPVLTIIYLCISFFLRQVRPGFDDICLDICFCVIMLMQVSGVIHNLFVGRNNLLWQFISRL